MRPLLLLLCIHFNDVHAVEIPDVCFAGPPGPPCSEVETRYRLERRQNQLDRCVAVQVCPGKGNFATEKQCYETCVALHARDRCNPPRQQVLCIDPSPLYIPKGHECVLIQGCSQLQGTFKEMNKCEEACLLTKPDSCDLRCRRIKCKYPKSVCGQIRKSPLQCGCYEPKRVDCSQVCRHETCPSDTLCGYHNGYCACHRPLKHCKALCVNTFCGEGSQCQSLPWGECGCAPIRRICDSVSCPRCQECRELSPCPIGSICPVAYECVPSSGQECFSGGEVDASA